MRHFKRTYNTDYNKVSELTIETTKCD